MTEMRASSADQSGSSCGVGATLAWMAFRKPASSKAAARPRRFDDVRHPFLGRGRIDVEHDRLHRLALGRLGVLLLQAPAGDEVALLGLVVGKAVIRMAVCEVADPGVARRPIIGLSGNFTNE